jgi:hypothetical protein
MGPRPAGPVQTFVGVLPSGAGEEAIPGGRGGEGDVWDDIVALTAAAFAIAIGADLLRRVQFDRPRYDVTWVVRGGEASEANLRAGAEREPPNHIIDAADRVWGLSTQSYPGKSVAELRASGRNFRYKQISAATVDLVRKARGDVIPTGTPDDPYHADVNGLTVFTITVLFTRIANPSYAGN